MYFKQFLHDDLGCSSYFVASRQSRDAVVIDPAYDVQPYLDLAAERGYCIRLVIDTHLHADHLSGNRTLAAATGADLGLHESADAVFPFRGLRDGEEIHLGTLLLRIAHTPGHRPESISIELINPPRSPEPSMVLSGDTLFVGDVGRPDFGGDDGARQEYRSVQRLLALPDYVEVFPAHFEGFCGKGMCGRPSTTIGFERRFNPVLQLSEPAFLELAAEVPARPLNMTAILETNRGAADYGWVRVSHEYDGEVGHVGVDTLGGWLQTHDALIVDVREPSEFEQARIPGAVSIPQADLATRLDEIPKDRELLLVCAGGARSLRAAQFLHAVGYERVTNLDGGTNGWLAQQRSTPTSA
jgi:hydroxyacylglutathione hydrolase